jgi:hypothetical protein
MSATEMITTEPLSTVKLNPNGGKPAITRIPRHAVVKQLGPSKLNGMVDIDWLGVRYAVFVEDLQRRARPA